MLFLTSLLCLFALAQGQQSTCDCATTPVKVITQTTTLPATEVQTSYYSTIIKTYFEAVVLGSASALTVSTPTAPPSTSIITVIRNGSGYITLSNATYASNATFLNPGTTTTTITQVAGASTGVVTSVVEAFATSTMITPIGHPAVETAFSTQKNTQVLLSTTTDSLTFTAYSDVIPTTTLTITPTSYNITSAILQRRDVTDHRTTVVVVTTTVIVSGPPTTVSSTSTPAATCACQDIEARDVAPASTRYETVSVTLTSISYVPGISTSSIWSTYTEYAGTDYAVSFYTVQPVVITVTSTALAPTGSSTLALWSNSTVTITSTSVSIVPEPSSIGDCPYSNEQNYVTPNSIQFQRFCDLSLSSSSSVLETYELDLKTCMDLCSIEPHCVAVAYPQPSVCSLMSSQVGLVTQNGSVFANATGVIQNSTMTSTIVKYANSTINAGYTTATTTALAMATAPAVLLGCDVLPVQNPSFFDNLDSWHLDLSADSGSSTANIQISTRGHTDGSSLELTVNLEETNSQPDDDDDCNDCDDDLGRRDMMQTSASSDSTAMVSQTLSTCAGLEYTLSYWYNQNIAADSDSSDLHLAIMINGIPLQALQGGDADSFKNAPAGFWFQSPNVSFVANSNVTTLQFQLSDASLNQTSILLDDILLAPSSQLPIILGPPEDGQLLYNPTLLDNFAGWNFGTDGNALLTSGAQVSMYDQSYESQTFAGMQCSGEGYLFLAQQVSSMIPGSTYVFSFNYLFDGTDLTNVTTPVVQVLLDDRIIDSFVPEPTSEEFESLFELSWNSSSTVFVVDADSALIELRMNSPSTDTIASLGDIDGLSLRVFEPPSSCQTATASLENSNFTSGMNPWQSYTTSADQSVSLASGTTSYANLTCTSVPDADTQYATIFQTFSTCPFTYYSLQLDYLWFGDDGIIQVLIDEQVVQVLGPTSGNGDSADWSRSPALLLQAQADVTNLSFTWACSSGGTLTAGVSTVSFLTSNDTSSVQYSTTNTTSMVSNFELECGLQNWTGQTDGSASYSVNAPGYSDSSAALLICGLNNTAQNSDVYSSIVESTVMLSQIVPTTVGVAYDFSFWYRFDQAFGTIENTVEISLSANGTSLQSVGVWDPNLQDVGVWLQAVTGPSLADATETVIELQISCNEGVGAYIRFDEIYMELSAQQPPSLCSAALNPKDTPSSINPPPSTDTPKDLSSFILVVDTDCDQAQYVYTTGITDIIGVPASAQSGVFSLTSDRTTATTLSIDPDTQRLGTADGQFFAVVDFGSNNVPPARDLVRRSDHDWGTFGIC